MKRVFVICIVIVCVVGVYWFFSQPHTIVTTTSDQASSTNSTNDAATVLYSDTTYDFSLQYPQGYAVQEYDEGDGSHTVTFTSPDQSQAFQVFVVPYTQNYITPERFKIDDPSGVMGDPQDIAVDGAPAKIFFGHNDQMGDTREVWFIHGGFLYEVTTYKALDSWLAAILTTWQFL